ncbi:hypothetical protein [Nannocystis radixulma]|uniref:Uncharacterized protein n=1 Tax=Nannocystis radixulma TaxID=2995305 RepID=A0ABT5BBV4_9BACT|nr:hypothetical protein [Nannocystis radixulma]MDC0671619.1 hypothetical protein [Nannocystis radixulma]
MPEPLPLRTKVIIRFQMPGDERRSARSRASRTHYYLQYAGSDGLRALTGAGLRFLRFVPEIGAPVPEDRLH